MSLGHFYKVYPLLHLSTDLFFINRKHTIIYSSSSPYTGGLGPTSQNTWNTYRLCCQFHLEDL